MLYEVITRFQISGVVVTSNDVHRGLGLVVITSYSIHYTKLYDYDNTGNLESLGKAGPGNSTPLAPEPETIRWFIPRVTPFIVDGMIAKDHQ